MLFALLLCGSLVMVQAAPSRTGSVASARAVLTRLLGSHAQAFQLSLVPPDSGRDVFEVAAANGIVQVKGSDPVAICRGAYHYLRNACNVEVTWSGTHCELPARLPDFPRTRVVSPNEFRQYFNVCTFGYTTVWWDWPRWEREIDWMALHGINMPLAMVGEEAIWQKVWKSMGITDNELADYFTGPAFLPWHRMGNVNKHGGPLPQGWIDGQATLQKKILGRMRELGMNPVVPAFSGFVPGAFRRIHPGAHVEDLSAWGNFPPDHRTHLLFPTSPYFHEIGVRFIQEYHKVFGHVRYYLADSFNEMQVPVSPKGRYDELAAFGKGVYSPIADADPRGVWVMQGWLFYNDAGFWDTASVQALLRDVPDNRMIILDLANEAFHGWKVQHGFYGKEWIYSMIHNYGGNNPLNGNLRIVARDPIESLRSPDAGHRVGMGLAPEGIENNDVIYELATDMMWRTDSLDLPSWLTAYARARYGSCPPSMQRAWEGLLASAYSKGAGNIRHGFQERPRMNPRGNVDTSPAFRRAVLDFLSCSDQLGKEPLYIADAIELTAQLLGGIADQRLREALRAHESGLPALRDTLEAEAFSIMDDIDALLNTRANRRLERWVDDARRWGGTDAEKNYYEWNAKLQVTLWGGPDLFDYASKLWSGLIRDFYVVRWKRFFTLLQTIPPGRPVPVDSLISTEEAWTRSHGVSPARSIADPLGYARALAEARTMSSALVPEPVILPVRSIAEQDSAVDIVFQSSEPQALIRYTFDGTAPTNTSPVYRAPIQLTHDASVSARAFVPGKFPSFVASRHYSFVEPGRNGLVCSYFEGSWIQLPDFDTITVASKMTAYEFDLEQIPHRNDFFGLRYSGYLRIDTSGTYEFTVGSDDGSRLMIDSNVIVSNDGLHAYLERSGTVKLEPGFHAIRIEYFEYGGDEKLSVQMEGPGLSRGPIPPSKVFLEKILR
ncbi:MAG: alpha-N-acetylglucosaminidase TIM-barrel domain-containing protein [Bacteroidota bacterium]